MRNLSLFILSFILVVACKKNVAYNSPNLLETPKKIRDYLRENLMDSDFRQLAFLDPIHIMMDSGRVNLWRIRFIEKPISSDFVIIQTDQFGFCINARIIHINQNDVNFGQFNGSINVSSLGRKTILASSISDGYIIALHKTRIPAVIASALPQITLIPADDGAEVLPDVVVVGYINSESGSVSLTTYMKFMTIMAVSPTGGGGSGSSSSSGSGATYGNSSNGSPESSPSISGNATDIYNALDPTSGSIVSSSIIIDYENGFNDPAILLSAYINSFKLVPDNSSTIYSVTILTDIPVDSNPNDLFSFSSGSPGHTFLQLTKKNGTQSVTQNIGFYPNGSFKSLINCSPVQAKFVDNAFHEYNASLKMNVNATSFQAALNTLMSFSTAQYDIDQFNCTDLALQVFNSSRTGTSLSIPLYHIPGSPIAQSNTPQGLYFELNNMIQSSSPEAGNIIAAPIKFYVGASFGPSN